MMLLIAQEKRLKKLKYNFKNINDRLGRIEEKK